MTTAYKVISPSSTVVPKFKLSNIPIFSKELEGENVKHVDNGFERIMSSFLIRNVHHEIIDNTQALIVETEYAVQGETMKELKNPVVEDENTVMQNRKRREIGQKLQIGLEKLKEVMQKLKNMFKESVRDSGIIKKIFAFLKKFGATKTILVFFEKLGESKVVNDDKRELEGHVDELMTCTEEETFVVKSSDWLKYPYNLKNYLTYRPDLPQQERIDIACEIAMVLIRIYKKEQKKKLHCKITSENIVLKENLIPGLYISNEDQNSTTVEQSPTTIVQGFTTILWDLLPTNGNVLLETIPVGYQEVARQGNDSDLASRPTMEEILDKLLHAFVDQTKFERENIQEAKSSHDDNDISKAKSKDYKRVPYSPEDDDFFRAEYKRNHRNIRDLDENDDFLKASCFIKPDSNQGIPTTSHIPRFDKSRVLLKEAKKLHLEGRHKEAWSKFDENIKISDSAESNYWVGYYYIKGLHGKGRDIPNGKEYLLKAAKGGHRDGQYWYAYLIRNHSRTKIEDSDGNDKVMIEFLEKAAKQNHPEAMKLLGFTLIRRGKEEGKEEGKDWLEKSKKAKEPKRNDRRENVEFLSKKPMKNSMEINVGPVVNNSRIPIRKKSSQNLSPSPKKPTTMT